MTSVRALLASASLLCASTAAFAAPPETALGFNAGTLGVGIATTFDINRHLNARVIVSGLKFDPGIEADADDDDGFSDDLEYEGDLDLFNVGALLDYHPFGGGLRLSTGVIFANNVFEASATCEATGGCELGDQPGVVLQGDRIEADIEYKAVAPYLGLGWGNAVSETGRWSFSIDLGVMYTGEGDADVRCSSALTTNQTTCQLSANEEEAEIEDDLEDYEFYPVLQMGLAYRF